MNEPKFVIIGSVVSQIHLGRLNQPTRIILNLRHSPRNVITPPQR